MLTIEQLWQDLRGIGSGTRQRRVDADHPFDLYVDFDPPDRLGLVAVCATMPPTYRSLRAVSVGHAKRADGRWSLRFALEEPGLLAVFTALCRDIVLFTRSGVSEAGLAAAVLGRLDHWRSLLERDPSGLGEASLRGLMGELVVLETYVLVTLPPAQAVKTWTGPLGTPQDFQMPSGDRIEVKAVRRDATTVRINGLQQLDPGQYRLVLMVARFEDTGSAAPDAITAPILVRRLQDRIGVDPEALAAFNISLAFVGWHDNPAHSALAVRLVTIDRHDVGAGFPRLIRASVPQGLEDADYTIALPRQGLPQ